MFSGIFSGGWGESGGGVTWKYLSMEEFFMGEENFREGGAVLKTMSFSVSTWVKIHQGASED